MKEIIVQKYKRFVLFIEISIFIILLFVAYNFVPINKDTQTIYIPSSEITEVIQTLEDNGYTVTWLDRLMLSVVKVPSKGWYCIDPKKSGRYPFFMYLHTQKTDALMDIIIYAGETKHELTRRLANDMKLTQNKLLEAYHALSKFKEGDIFAGRYTIARKADANTTISYLFKNTQQKLKIFEEKYFKKKPDTQALKVIYTIASIIQKESNSIEEMPLISSVIYNRLKKGMKLQMDGTLNYGKYAHTIITPERIKNDESLYNTYKHKGLPPHPLSNISIDALKASIRPVKSEYLFFMLNKNGTHDFTVNYVEHLNKIRAFRVYQKERRAAKALADAIENNISIEKSFGFSLDTSKFK